MMKLDLEGMRIFMAAEIDCQAEGGGYIELKTSKLIRSERDSSVFERHKLLKFWLQSFLAGVPRIVVGFRDDAGAVHKLQTLQTLEIPRIVRGKPGLWDASVCLNFGRVVLEWLLREVAKLPRSSRLVLRYEPARRALLLLRSADAPALSPSGAPPGDGEGDPADDAPPAKRQRS